MQKENLVSEQHSLGQKVALIDSGETGTIIGLANYQYLEPQALIRYKCADGRLIESWWGISAIKTTK